MTAPESWYATRTMRALELLAMAPRSASEVASALQVHPRTARRLLNRLVDEEYVTRSEGERRIYSPTMRLVALAGQVVERSQLTRSAIPFVQQLQERTGAAAHLGVPSYRSVLCLVHRARNSVDPIAPQLRELVPCHCTATGKALLAYRERWRSSVLSQPLERHTERTLTEPSVILAELARIRMRGWAFEDREYRADARAVAAPVRDASGEVVAALSASGHTSELANEQLQAVTAIVVELAAAMSRALGDDSGATARHEVQ
jgi:DNA-binding IclR family transcriptional regulator